MVYFFAEPMIDKNVLGRIGWLDRVRLGLLHHDKAGFLGRARPNLALYHWSTQFLAGPV